MTGPGANESLSLDATTIMQEANAGALLAAIVESSSDAIIGKDLRGIVTSWNAGAEKMFGYTAAEMIGKPVARLIPAERHAEEVRILERIGAGETIKSFDTVRVRKDGTAFPISATISAIKDRTGRVIGGSKIARDLSETRRADEALRQSEERLAFVRRSSGVGFWYCDLPFDVLQWDELVKAHFHLPPDATVTIQTFYDRIHPDDREPTRLAIERSIADKTPYNTDYRTVNPFTGAVAWVRAIGRTFYDAHGKPKRFDGVTLDVSDRKRAENEVIRLAAESERQRRLYETVLTNTPDFVYVFSLEHRVLYANDALLKMWGRGQDGAIGKTFLEIGYEPWHAAMHDREIDQVRATRQPIRGEVPFNGTHGRRMYDYIFVPIIGANGEVEAVAGTTRDVTERKQSEERQSLLVALADTIRPLSDPIKVKAEASRVLGERLGANRVVYFEVRGDDFVVERDYTDAVPSVVGRHTVVSFGPEMLATYKAGRTACESDVNAFPSRTAEEKAAFAAVQIRAYVGVPLVKGKVFVAGVAVHMAAPRAWTPTEIAMIEDTAERTWAAVERVRAEQEVARLAAQADRERVLFDTTLSNTTDFNFIFSPDGRFLYANRSLLALWNQTAAEAIGKTMAELDYPPDVEAQLLSNIRRVIETGQVISDETPFTAPNKEIGYYEYALAPVFDAAGTVVQVVGSARDIRDRKRTEDELRRLAAELREASRRKDEFLAILAHELRNPLAPIRNGLQVIRMAEPNATIEQTRSMMERQLTQLVRLVDDLLDVSRVTSGKLELRRAKIELRAVIDAAVETSRPVIEGAGHTLTVALSDERIWVDADLTRLSQALSNLLNNSAKYMHRGGHVRLTVGLKDGMAVVSVADDGIGIPPTMLDKVFEMFIQVDRTLEKTTGGLGIGLSLVKGLVEMHGGTIEARSDGEGRGSEFVMRLPVSRAAPEIESPKTGEVICSSSSRRILVADDNQDSAEMLGIVLEMLGNSVNTANDGLKALEMAETFRPEVILLDIGMPKLNGYQTCRRIREKPWGKNALLIALTGWGQDEDKRQAQEAGFDHHMVKPVDPDALIKLLSSSDGVHRQ